MEITKENPLKLTLNLTNPHLGGLAVAFLIGETIPVEIAWADETSIVYPDSRRFLCETNNDVLRALARASAPQYKLYGETAIEQTLVDHWLGFTLICNRNFDESLSFVDKSLESVTFLVAHKLSIADFGLFDEMYWRYPTLSAKGLSPHIQRWYDLISAQASVQRAVESLPPAAREALTRRGNAGKEREPTAPGERKQEGKFDNLPGAEMGKVVVRFPPEASGYLHIGHAKAALLNQYYANAFKGTLIMRFDDTNPAKETVEFENVILGDLELLQIKPDIFTHTSNYFDLMIEYCERMLKEGKAYVDDTPPERMKLERDSKTESANRANDVEKNLSMWREMLEGTEKGQKCCVRAKIDMASLNGCMRDPTIYRCKNEPHPRTGTKYKVYPTYDFACPIVDAIENVTHTLRTMEYHDRDDQFYWFIDALGLRKPYIYEYSRLNMTHTVLSKRRLTWFVESDLVDGWDDPRMPTVRGILRRGMTVAGLREFIIAQGSSKSVVFMDWDKIWAFNKKVIDPIAPRYTALDFDNRVVVNVAGIAKNETVSVPVHPKNTALGMKNITLGPRVYIDYADADTLTEGQNATFINWGNLLVNKVHRDAAGKVTHVDAALNLDNKDFKNTPKLTWLAVEDDEQTYPPTFCVYFENIISKAVLGKDEDFKQYTNHKTREEVEMLGDPELKRCQKGDIIQLQRRGFFKVDVSYAPPSPFSKAIRPVILFYIPDGHTKEKQSAGVKKSAQSSSPVTATDLEQELAEKNESLRKLQEQNSAKDQIDETLKKISELKKKYKKATGKDWQPKTLPSAAEINAKIAKQGDVVRGLKAQKAPKSEVEPQVKILIELKAAYKTATGQDWKPGVVAPEPKKMDAPPTTAAAAGTASSAVADVLDKIAAQGNVVRQLKADKAEKAAIDAAVKALLEHKEEYKTLTGTAWKPGAVAPQPEQPKMEAPQTTAAASGTASSAIADVLDHIAAQGNVVRQLKADKAEKAIIDAAVKALLEHKEEYKTLTGTAWKPGAVAPQPAQPKMEAPQATAAASGTASSAVADVLDKIAAQGNVVRQLKADKAEKAAIDAAVKALLEHKEEYKTLTGTAWKPGAVAPIVVKREKSPGPPESLAIAELLAKIAAQGGRIRQLKAEKAAKDVIDPEVRLLLALKTDYKSLTGVDWKPEATAAASSTAAAAAVAQTIDLTKDTDEVAKILESIKDQGVKVRYLKASKAEKPVIDVEVQQLKRLKAEYQTLAGKPWTPEAGTPAEGSASGEDGRLLTDKEKEEQMARFTALKARYLEITGTEFVVIGETEKAKEPESKPLKANKKGQAPTPKAGDAASTGAVKKQTRLGLEATKEGNLPDWYSQIITKGELIEYYDVSGCYILRQWSFAIWKFIRNWFDGKITKMGVKECYFPIFVSRSALEREKTHIADFAPEVAWVTKSGETELAEPIAVRPTSETVMYPAYAKWIQSYRDLPLRLNQWSNVVRWEFKHPQPFLRTREFLWQEGHTAFATKEEADKEVLDILDLYAQVYTDLLAIPVVKGRKTEKEQFAGSDYTTTVEAYIAASGRGIQGATSHHLGQNFSKMFEIVFEDPETQQKQYVYQNSWGITTRTIGVMIMVHADNQGLVLPPHVAAIQAIIVPCGITVNTKDEERQQLLSACETLEQKLVAYDVRCEGDYRDNYSPGWKFNHWELKGVPIRIEVGPKDLRSKQIVAVRRDTGEKLILAIEDVEHKIKQLLATIHDSMLAKATVELRRGTKITKNWGDFCNFLEQKNLLLSPFCGAVKCEENIKADSARDDDTAEPGAPSMGAKSLCIPFEQPCSIGEKDKCIHPSCTDKPKFYTLFGRSY